MYYNFYHYSYKMNASESYALTITALVISIGGIVIGVVNHKRIKSSCCGVKTEVSLDIEQTSPKYEPPYKVDGGS